ncbi:MAG: type I restriction-modification system subunit M [Bacteroidaceae bacterium]|nr:type I restriction-modification system subunit M [Bacteroidaceae bacterium]
MAKETNTTSIGFEDKIWQAADVLRGNLNAAEYEGVVLGLIFLKYISDRFETKFLELQNDEYADPEDMDEYTAENIFFVPQGARWSVISAAAHTPEIGNVIDEALKLIEQSNDRLKGILPKNFARPELDKRRLGEVVDLFTNIQMHDAGEERDLLGRTYEYCLQKFASMEGKNAGEFYTPSCIVRTIVEILQPYEGRIYDPACGSGGMFVQSAKFIARHQKSVDKISIFGQEANPSTWKMCHMNLAIRGLEGNLGKTYADTFFDDQHPTLKADFIMANPPFNLDKWGQPSLQEDVRWKYGIPPSGNANFAWMQHMIHHLSPKGKIGLVLANGALSSQTGGEGEIRKNIILDDLVECIVALPSQLFYSTGIPVSLWFLSRTKKQPGKTLFIDARNMGTMVTRKLRELTVDGDIKKIADTYNAFIDGTLENEKGFCAVVETAEIEKQDFILTPGRYVGIAEQEDDGEPFAEKMERLTSELSDLFSESHRLEEEIKKQLGSIGFEI